MAAKITRPAALNVGITDVNRWRISDEVHLPDGSKTTPVFMPEVRPLDSILRRETIDERLAADVVPEGIAPELLTPSVLTATRLSLKSRLEEAASQVNGAEQRSILAGAELLETEVALDAEIQEALAALLKG